MKKLSLALLLLMACKPSAESQTTKEANADSSRTEVTSTSVQPPETEKKPVDTVATTAKQEQTALPEETVAAKGAPLEYLLKFDKKYPQDVKLFETGVLPKRLRKLLGTKYELFKTNLGVQTPIEVKEGVLMTSGIAPHEGGSEEAVLVIHVPRNLIYVAILSAGQQGQPSTVQQYTEGHPDGAPNAFWNWIKERR